MAKIDFHSMGLKEKNTFDSLVIGTHNHIAAKACLEVAKSPGDAYNPLFLSGPDGVGKSHLMHAVGVSMLKVDSHLKVKYISSERFANEIISAIANDNVMALRDHYSKLDLLMLDDIQYLVESKSAQAEFIHIFNILHQDNKQIILGGDQPPKKLTGLDKVIRSRLEWGLSVDIKLPDIKSRVDILKIKKAKHKIDLTDEMVQYVAGMLKSDPRELEGFLKKISAYVTLSYQKLNMELVKTVVREILPEGQADVEPEKLDTSQQSDAATSQKQQSQSKSVEDVVEEIQVQNGPPEKISDVPSKTPATPKHKKPLEVVMPTPPEPPKKPLEPPIAKSPPSSPVSPPKSKKEESKKAKKEKPKPEKVEGKKEEVKEEAELPDIPDYEEAEGELPAGHKEVGAVFFFPSGGEKALENVYRKFQEVIKKHKLKFRLKRVSSDVYECSGKINYSNFVEVCKQNKVPVAIVIGPPPASFVPEQDFFDLLSVTLDVQGISLQLVNWGEINKDYKYLNLALDIALVRSR